MKSKQKINHIFKQYVLKFDIENPKIKRKYEHIFRVAKISEDIANNIKNEYSLAKEDIDIAYLIGILHDIGKFDQINMYNTCQDKKSFDHGNYGAKLLQDGMIRQFINENDYDNIIISSVKYHNKFKIEDKYDERTMLFINILRDADKLDIFYEFANKMIDIYDCKYNYELTKEVIEKFERNKMINKDITKTKNDEFLSSIAMVYDLKFDYSLKYLKDNKYIDSIFNQINVQDDAKELYMDLRNHINQYIGGNYD